MNGNSCQQTKEEEEAGEECANSGIKAPPPFIKTSNVATGEPLFSYPEQPPSIKRTDTDTTDQESCAAYSTRAVLHEDVNKHSTLGTTSKSVKTRLFKGRGHSSPKFAILGVSVTLLCAVVTGVALFILIPRNTNSSDGNYNGTNSNIGDDGHNDTTTTNSTNITTNNTTTTTNTTTDDNETDTLFDNNGGILDCASQTTADDSWNAIPSHHDDGGMMNSTLLLGPMVGHVTETTAKLWAVYENATLATTTSIVYQRLGECPSPRVEVMNMPFNTTTVNLVNLTSNALYRFQVLIKNTKVGEMGSFTTVGQNVTQFRYMFGSCISFKRDATQTIWNDILLKEPEFLILNGDTVYSNTLNYTRHWEYHRIQRRIPTFRNIIRQVPVLATWDDHDFGPNDSDGLIQGKEESLRAFSDLFANPYFGTPTHPGIYSTFKHGDHVQFFIIDNRYHRMEDTMYAGPEQLQWLQQNLANSSAVFKIIVHGGTIRRAGSQSWFERSKRERRDLLDFLALNNITGVVFHGGDIHKNLLNPHPKFPSNQTLDYEVYELVSSGLTNRGGCYTIVDIDTENRTLEYSMMEAGQELERGRLTIAKDTGVITHTLLHRSQLMALELDDCQQNLTRTTTAYPVIGGLAS